MFHLPFLSLPKIKIRLEISHHFFEFSFPKNRSDCIPKRRQEEKRISSPLARRRRRIEEGNILSVLTLGSGGGGGLPPFSPTLPPSSMQGSLPPPRMHIGPPPLLLKTQGHVPFSPSLFFWGVGLSHSPVCARGGTHLWWEKEGVACTLQRSS